MKEENKERAKLLHHALVTHPDEFIEMLQAAQGMIDDEYCGREHDDVCKKLTALVGDK